MRASDCSCGPLTCDYAVSDDGRNKSRWDPIRLSAPLLGALKALRVVPPGAARVSGTLNIVASGLAESGKLGIFTPVYFTGFAL